MQSSRGVALVAVLAVAAALPAQHALVGQVRWPDRRVAEGVHVHARWRAHAELPGCVGWTYPDAVATGEAVTEANGRFRIEMVDPAACELWAVTADGAHATPLHFPTLPGVFAELELGDAGCIGGLVVDVDGEPQREMAIRLEPHETTWPRYATYGRPVLRGELRTDAEGRFALPWTNGYLRVPQIEPFVVLEPADATRRFRGVQMVRPTKMSRAMQLVVESMPEVTGRVLDQRGEPLAGVTVAPRHQPWRRVPTDATGGFSLHTDAQPHVGLLAVADGFAPRAALRPEPVGPRAVTLRLGKAARCHMRLVDEDHKPLGNLEVLWSAAQQGGPPREWRDRSDPHGFVTCAAVGDAAPTFGFAFVLGKMRRFAVLSGTEDRELGDVVVLQRQLQGQALDPDGVPLAAARVVVRPVADEALGEHANVWVGYTDAGGGFAFAALPAGELRVMLEAGVHGFASTVVVADAPQHERITLQPSRDGVVELDAVDERGDPVPGAWAMLLRIGGGDTFAPAPRTDSVAVCVFADAHGRVRVTGLPDGQWRVQVQSLRDGQLRAGSVQCGTGEPSVAVPLRVMPL
ncbi:MAG: carboxypeptidase-like regulatory domain-containing protein [Planctomycetota bacterium]